MRTSALPSVGTILIGLVAVGLLACSTGGGEVSPSPTVSTSTQGSSTVPTSDAVDGADVLTLGLRTTREAGGVGVQTTLTWIVAGEREVTHRSTGLVDLSGGDADLEVRRGEAYALRRVVDGVSYEQKAGQATWQRSAVAGEGLIGGDAAGVLGALERVRAPRARAIDGGTRITGSLDIDEAITVSGLPRTVAARIRQAGTVAATVIVDVDSNGLITAIRQDLLVPSSSGTITARTTIAFTDYGQVVMVDVPEGTITD